MKPTLAELDLRRAFSLDEALQIMRSDPRRPMAGAPDIGVALNFGTTTVRRVLDIQPLAELRAIRVEQDTLVIGALATYRAILQSPDVISRLPMLVQAAGQIGGVQIQNRGTLAGNVANASPAGDSLPVLVAANASVVLRSIDSERRVALTQFYTGYRATVAREDELIVAIEVPRVPGVQWFRKVGTRAAQAISKIVMAGVRDRERDVVRIAVGSVAPTVVRAVRTEGALAIGASIDEAAVVLDGEIAPIDDIRSTAVYRRRVTGNLLRRFWVDTA